jgi:hypothetical protein
VLLLLLLLLVLRHRQGHPLALRLLLSGREAQARS